MKFLQNCFRDSVSCLVYEGFFMIIRQLPYFFLVNNYILFSIFSTTNQKMKIKVSIVDDNSFLINAVIEKLSFFDNVEVKHTSLNGSELLTRLEENHNIDLILMDYLTMSTF